MKSGKIIDSVGYKGVSGTTISKEKYYKQLKRNGYEVKHTKHGVFVTRKEGRS